MARIEYIKQDVTQVKEGLILHGCNCSGGFGSGVAGAIRKKWPIVYEAFKLAPLGKRMLGKVQYVTIDMGLYVGNCFTQEKFGGGGVDENGDTYADAEAVIDALIDAFEFADKSSDIKSVYMPMIGCGLGGLNWEKDLKKDVEYLATHHLAQNITLYICDI